MPMTTAAIEAPNLVETLFVMFWFLFNMLTGAAYLYIPICMERWFRGIPNYGTGFRALARLFQIFIILCGAHHLTMLLSVWHHPVSLLSLIVDGAMAIVSMVTAFFLTFYNSMIAGAFQSMLKHNEEWREDGE